jgi:hypothetical protein
MTTLPAPRDNNTSSAGSDNLWCPLLLGPYAARIVAGRFQALTSNTPARHSAA